MKIESKKLDNEQIQMLHHLKRLLDEEGDEGGKKELKTAVKDILKRKSKIGEIVTSLKPLFTKLAIGFYKSGKFEASQSALALLKSKG